MVRMFLFYRLRCRRDQEVKIVFLNEMIICTRFRYNNKFYVSKCQSIKFIVFKIFDFVRSTTCLLFVYIRSTVTPSNIFHNESNRMNEVKYILMLLYIEFTILSKLSIKNRSFHFKGQTRPLDLLYASIYKKKEHIFNTLCIY